MSTKQDYIRIRGARVHNLKNVDIDIPLGKLICFAGPSGSGKTSLAFHTLLNESKRRFVNSFPNSVKFFADRPAAVDVDEIFPVLPVFGLPQINPVMGSRSTVADIMRVTEPLQSLYFNYAQEFCPTHMEPVSVVSFSSQLANVIENNKAEVWHILLPKEIYGSIFIDGFSTVRSWNTRRKTIESFDSEDDYWEILRFKKSSLSSIDQKNIDLIDKIKGKGLFLWGEGLKSLIPFSYQSRKKCSLCDYFGKSAVSASAFSPHSALGACKSCNGYGANLVYDEDKLIDKALSIEEGGVSFLNFGPLDWWGKQLRKEMKKKKISLSTPIEKQPKGFIKFLLNGEGDWEGFEGVRSYLESKRYKPAVRVFIRKLQKEVTCKACIGSRIDASVKNFLFKYGERNYSLLDYPSLALEEFTQVLGQKVSLKNQHALKLCHDLKKKCLLACAMGLGHLSLGRKARSLSAGEYQRLLLLKYLSFEGTDALFILDEPSLGLGLVEQKMLIQGLREIISQGNTVILIDHSDFMIRSSDHVIVMGPGSGALGGEVLNEGPPDKVGEAVLSHSPLKKLAKPTKLQYIEVDSPSCYGRSWSSFRVAKNSITHVTGPSGCGKSSRLVNVLAQHIYKTLHHQNLVDIPGTFKSIKGVKDIQDVTVIDSNLNRFTSRSTVGTITEMAPVVRKHFLKLPVAKSMGLKDGHLSPNSDLGMCPRCEGRGQVIIEMQYLEDIVLTCDDCGGKRIRPLYAEISDGKMTVADAFNKPLNEILPLIELTPKFKRIWEYLKILNLDYLSLERPLNTLSGGEKQRIYLLSCLLGELENQLIIFENLSFGLAKKDIIRICGFLESLAHRGNTLVIIDSDPLFSVLSHQILSLDL